MKNTLLILLVLSTVGCNNSVTEDDIYGFWTVQDVIIDGESKINGHGGVWAFNSDGSFSAPFYGESKVKWKLKGDCLLLLNQTYKPDSMCHKIWFESSGELIVNMRKDENHLVVHLRKDSTNSQDNLVTFENDYAIDLTNIDSVRVNLNGFWIEEENINSKEILWLNFLPNSYSTNWIMIPYNKEISKSHKLPMESCPTNAELLKMNNETHIRFVGLVYSDTAKIEQLTKTKLKIEGITYLKHKGYPFLQTQWR